MARAVSPSFRHARPAVRGGRGARSNHTGRYEHEARSYTADGWATTSPEPTGPQAKTELVMDRPRRIITYNDSPFVGFDRSINPYRGCEHGCIYCFARPTHAYLGYSPGEDFERVIIVKPGADALLDRELRARRYTCAPIAIGTNTDPYQPAERGCRQMRGILTTLAAFRHPVSILTKSDLILRDLDLIAPLAEAGLARAMVSITTLDRQLARAMEPRAPTPQKRLDAVRRLADAGIPTGVVHGPIIPGLSDPELETLMAEARGAGATYAAYTMLRLPLEVAGLFEEWLATFAPNRASRVLGHLRDMNGGRTHDPNWSREHGPKGAFAQLIHQRFQMAHRRLGFDEMPGLRTDLFAVPRQPSPQGDLFG